MARFLLWLSCSPAGLRMRSKQEAQDIYDAGQSFCKASKFLCVIHVRRVCKRVHAKVSRQQNMAAKMSPIQWRIKPKLHSFDHQLQTLLKTRTNMRHVHCYTDEDAMKHLKSLCIGYTGDDLERFLLRAMRLRMRLAVKNMAGMRISSMKRSRR